MLSMTTDYATDSGCPEPYLRRIAESGFSHVHWCHHWNSDFLYDDCEMEQIGTWLQEFGLEVTDLHGSLGKEKNWGSVREYERLAGVELVRNRIRMAERLGTDVVIMHLPKLDDPATRPVVWDQVRRSLNTLQPCAWERGVRIALENGPMKDIEKLLWQYEPRFLGLCYDCGHGNLVAGALDWLERLKDRLISVHLHDNDGTADQHHLPFWEGGTVNWNRLVGILAKSSYKKWINLESNMKRSGMEDETTWLAMGAKAAQKLAAMLEGVLPASLNESA
mgnify:CR=1 FL=1